MQQQQQSAPNADFLDLLGLGVNGNTIPSTVISNSVPDVGATTITVFSRDNIDIRFFIRKEADYAVVTVKTTNNSLNMLDKYMFQVCGFFIWSFL